MPRVPRFRTDAIRDLYGQLRYAPLETRRRQMDAAEQLVAELDPAIDYPEEFVIFRVTGYRSDRLADPVMLAGDAVRGDLVNIVQHISADAELPSTYRDREPLSLETVCERLKVSPTTLQRYRRQGLVCHFITEADAQPRLMCFADALERFRDAHAARLKRASGFTRIEPDVTRRILERARKLKRSSNLSLNQAAQQLADQFQRSHEAVRGVLQRHDREANEPIFAERGPLSPTDRSVIHRAWLFGMAPAALARRFGKSPAAINRSINRVRCQKLRDLSLAWIDLPTFDLPEAESIILHTPAASSGLDHQVLCRDLLELLGDAHTASPIDEDREDSLLAAYNLLKKLAADHLSPLEASPPDQSIDPIETWLRWASLIKQQLIAMAFPAALHTIEQHRHRRLFEEPSDAIARGVLSAFQVISQTIDTLDPTRGQRLERLTRFAMDRTLAQRVKASRPARASARHQPGTLRLSPRAVQCTPWQTWLDGRPDFSALTDRLETSAAQLVRNRYGWSGTPPQTMSQLATSHDMSVASMRRLLSQTHQQLRELARS